jgi:hypothetical protein
MSRVGVLVVSESIIFNCSCLRVPVPVIQHPSFKPQTKRSARASLDKFDAGLPRATSYFKLGTPCISVLRPRQHFSRCVSSGAARATVWLRVRLQLQDDDNRILTLLTTSTIAKYSDLVDSRQNRPMRPTHHVEAT